MKKSPQPIDTTSEEKIILHTNKKNLNNKKIYFDSNGTHIEIGYDDETGVGFVEIIDNN
jgi:hypothetical protein